MDFIAIFLVGMALLFAVFFIVYAIQAGAIVGVAALGFKAFEKFTAERGTVASVTRDGKKGLSTLDELERLAELRRKGSLTDPEFEDLKRRLLS